MNVEVIEDRSGLEFTLQLFCLIQGSADYHLAGQDLAGTANGVRSESGSPRQPQAAQKSGWSMRVYDKTVPNDSNIQHASRQPAAFSHKTQTIYHHHSSSTPSLTTEHHLFLHSSSSISSIIIIHYIHYLSAIINLSYGGFPKWGYYQIIHFNGIFLCKPSIWGYPILGPPHILSSLAPDIHEELLLRSHDWL